MGRKKGKPSVPGRTEREQKYMNEHPRCERCNKKSVHCHHVEGRGLGGWNRDESPLEALCAKCHLEKHGQR